MIRFILIFRYSSINLDIDEYKLLFELVNALDSYSWDIIKGHDYPEHL